MSLRSWCKGLWAESRRPAKANSRLAVEELEDRMVLALNLPTDPFLFTPVAFGTPLALHIHPVVSITIDGQAVTIPAGTGVGPSSAFPLHTHTPDGVVHVESPVAHTFYLQDFFAIWNLYPQGQTVLNQLDTAPALTLTVDGATSVGLKPVALYDHENIVIQALSQTPDPTTAANEAFVTRVYGDLLHRGVDTVGLVAFTTALDQGLSRAAMVQALENSSEYQALEVRQLYRTFLHRDADAAGLASFTGYLAAGGTIGQVEAVLLGSPEYFQLSGGTNDGFLAALYADVLHRGLDPTGASVWGSQLAGGGTPAAVVNAVLHSGEAKDLEVEGFYQDFLRREADGAGLSAFSTALQQGMPEEQVLAIVLGSDEYFARR